MYHSNMLDDGVAVLALLITANALTHRIYLSCCDETSAACCCSSSSRSSWRCWRRSASVLVTMSSAHRNKRARQISLSTLISYVTQAPQDDVQKPVLTMKVSMAMPVMKQMGMIFLKIGASGMLDGSGFMLACCLLPWLSFVALPHFQRWHWCGPPPFGNSVLSRL